VPPSHGSTSGGSKKKGKHSIHDKGKEKAKGQGYGKIYLVSTVSSTPQTTYSIATITSQRLLQCIVVEDPETSSFGNGPYTSFNQAMTLTQCIGDCLSLRTVQALEEQVISESMTIPTPYSSPPPLSAADSMESCDTFGYTAEEHANISPCFLPHKCIPHMVPELDLTSEMMEDDECVSISGNSSLFRDFNEDDGPDCAGTSNWEELYQNDNRYILIECISNNATNLPSECACVAFSNIIAALGEKDRALICKLACLCKNSVACTCTLVSDDWMIDSSATMHLSPIKLDFINLQSDSNLEQIRTAGGDTKMLQIKGHGTVLIQHIFTEKRALHTKLLWIQNIAYVPGVVAWILSLSLLLQEGLHIYGDTVGLTLFIEGKYNIPFMQCEPHFVSKSLYWLKTEKLNTIGIHAVFTKDYDLMYCRLGHPSSKVLHHAKDCTAGFPAINFPSKTPLCSGCVLRKMANTSFPPSKNWTKELLIHIHSDIKSFPIESYHHHKYFISFVDDYISFAWITLLCTKSSVINALHKFLAMIKTQFRVTIKEWMSDAGREYKSDAFLKVLRENDIKVLQSAPHTPQQNGHAKHFNRTIMDKVVVEVETDA
jgi:hypothetical protein